MSSYIVYFCIYNIFKQCTGGSWGQMLTVPGALVEVATGRHTQGEGAGAVWDADGRRVKGVRVSLTLFFKTAALALRTTHPCLPHPPNAAGALCNPSLDLAVVASVSDRPFVDGSHICSCICLLLTLFCYSPNRLSHEGTQRQSVNRVESAGTDRKTVHRRAA